MYKILERIGCFLDKDISLVDFAIISNNCWGYQLYKNHNMRYNTPFVGLYIEPDDYIRLLFDPFKYLSVNLSEKHFKINRVGIICTIYDVEIVFLHYDNICEAILKWNRRRLRLLKFINNHGTDNLIVKFCDKDNPTDNAINLFYTLPYKRKIFIGNKARDGLYKYFKFPISGNKLFNVRVCYYLSYKNLFKN
ncbi:DUF1919 domain-containing protein [Aliivibrio fischeri]|uniref:DUF1919 domain-containing protein n=1 Tax=Aliivibrio fischeri TaxID=668 RepID=UPI0012DA95A0|nr:DUF1919 domain-containing protein [Aliivibrio fischeri]MUK67959.1 DUF1919 domain-containing protein [Aliivibrio fischeri]MUK72906.1 DUF1919 domain-containing protein [Aliivibrio fischeri]